MDAASLRRFHSSTVSWPSDPFFIPSGGLARFLRETLRFQVFLVSLGVFEDCWGTQTKDILRRGDMFNVCYFAAQVRQNELRGLFSRYNTPTEAAWMFHVLLVLIKMVGFDGDNGPPERGCTLIQVAAAEIEFLLQQCADTFMMHWSTDRTTFLDYEEYDPHRTVEGYFSGHRLPEEYTHIKIGSPSVPEFDPTRQNEYWLEAERVVEATLISLSRIKGSVRVEMGKDGEVLGVCKESVDELVSDMVASGTQDTGGLSPSLSTDVEGPAIVISVRPRTIPQLLELLERVQVPELEIAQGAEWKPIIPISEIMQRVVRPAVYLFQRILDPLFFDPSPRVPPPSMFTKRLQRVLRGILDLLPIKSFEQDLIAHQQPSGPCYQEIWHQTSLCHAVPVSDLCWQMLGLSNYFVMCCGFEGEETPSGTRLFNSLQKLRKVSKTWWMAYDMSHLQDNLSGLTPACQLRVLLSPIAPSAAERALGEKWIPPIAFPDYLHLLIRPSVYYIQNVVDDDFRMSSDTPVFPPMDHQAIRYAMRVIVEQMKLISISRPSYILSLMKGVNIVGIKDVMIAGESSQMFRIIEFLLSRVGFEGDDQASLEGALNIARKLSGLAEDWAALTGCAQEYAEYRGGKFERCLAECCVPRSITRPSPMPVRFALLSEAPPIYPITQCRDSFEVFYVDLLTWDGLQAYAARPDIVQYSENVLCPLCDVAVEVCGRFEFGLPNPSDAPWLRSRLAAYLHFASFIAEAISICSVSLAVAIPTPSISCLIYMNCLILRYGFEGDEDADSKIDALEKFASVIHIAQRAREDSDTRILGWKCLDTLAEEFEAWNTFPND
ncbi:hypothetical protein B0H10DRAFT_1953880 [Mycena sp. CBHHK59/15]|nr:hypothetical protein B0H10DRAFT_1953880 [Mycena sp. CBHHK59/15]